MNASVEKQIKALNKLGIDIGDQKKLGRFLLMNNVDYVMDVFGRCFLDPETKSYIAGTKFDEIMALHHYDEEIRGAMIKLTLISEFHLKSVIVNVFNAAHKKEDAYLDPLSFDNSEPTKLKELMGKIKVSCKNIKQNKGTKSTLSLTEFLNNTEFSVLKIFFGSMIPNERQSVASQLSNVLHDSHLLDDNIKAIELDALIENTHQLRNCLAHNNSLYDFKAESKPPYLKCLHQTFGILPENPRVDLYNTLLLLQPFVESNQFAIMYNTLIKRSNNLKGNLKSIDINIVFSQMGFPTNFHQYPKLVQGVRSKPVDLKTV